VTGQEEGTTNLGLHQCVAEMRANSVFMSQFLKAIAFGIFLGLLTVLTIILVWIAGVKFGQILWNM
jgi:hypothetical protein